MGRAAARVLRGSNPSPTASTCPTTRSRCLRNEDADMLSVFVLEEFFTARFGEHGELNVVEDYLKRRGWRESVPARRYLEALRDSTLSLYEVVDIVCGRHMTVRDLLLGGTPLRVEEKRGSQGAAPWDRLAARIVPDRGKYRFTGAILRFRHELSREFLTALEKMAGELQDGIRSDFRKRGATAPVTRELAREVMVRTALFARILSQFWIFDAVMRARAPAPETRNSDDEAVLLCDVRIQVTADEARVAEVLDGIGGFEREDDGEPRWRWFAAGSPLYRASRHRRGQSATGSSENRIGTTSLAYVETRKGTLVLSVDSRERAERGRELLASRLGDLVGPGLIAHQTPQRELEERSGQPPDEPEIPPEEALKLMHSYLDDHYWRTLDEPFPMFDGKTLREAAATPKGRVRVVDWLKQLENAEHHRAAQHGHRPYDTAWLWWELGIEAPV